MMVNYPPDCLWDAVAWTPNSVSGGHQTEPPSHSGTVQHWPDGTMLNTAIALVWASWEGVENFLGMDAESVASLLHSLSLVWARLYTATTNLQPYWRCCYQMYSTPDFHVCFVVASKSCCCCCLSINGLFDLPICLVIFSTCPTLSGFHLCSLLKGFNIIQTIFWEVF